MSVVNRFEMTRDGKVFINGMRLEKVTSVNTSSGGFGSTSITVTFDADEVNIASATKPSAPEREYSRLYADEYEG